MLLPLVFCCPLSLSLSLSANRLCLCQIVSLQYLSRSPLHRLAGLPSRIFLSYGLQVVTRNVHRSSLRRLVCPAQDHFTFLTLLIISYSLYTVPPLYNTVVGRHLLRPPYKRGALWEPNSGALDAVQELTGLGVQL